jgi:hypothetical protein
MEHLGPPAGRTLRVLWFWKCLLSFVFLKGKYNLSPLICWLTWWMLHFFTLGECFSVAWWTVTTLIPYLVFKSQSFVREMWLVLTTGRWYCYGKLVCLHTLLSEFGKLRIVTISFVVSVRPSSWNTSAAARRILMKFDIWVFFENLSREFKLH